MESAVTLIVKAPYNDIADQVVNCETNWTIRDLKGHLSSIYPCKPKSDEQRLIYSGQLLLDHLTLKDVLRHNNEDNTHTFHLVCTKYNTPLVPSMPVSDNNSGDGLRNRFNATVVREEPSNLSTPELTPEQRAAYQHMHQMHEMYTAYMTQYMSYLQGSNCPINSNFGSPAQSPEVNNVDPPQERVPAPEAAGAGIGEDDDEDLRPRDWLDWAFEMTRLILFLIVVYIYSNFTRVLMVALGFAFVYYYQRKHNNERVMQEGRDEAAANLPPRETTPEPASSHPPAPDSDNEPQDPSLQAPSPTEDASSTPADISEVNPYQEDIPSKFRIAFTFLYSLISSVIPIPEEDLN